MSDDDGYDDLETLTKDILKTIKKFKKNNDDILIRFTIDVQNRNEMIDEPVKKKEKDDISN